MSSTRPKTHSSSSPEPKYYQRSSSSGRKDSTSSREHAHLSPRRLRESVSPPPTNHGSRSRSPDQSAQRVESHSRGHSKRSSDRPHSSNKYSSSSRRSRSRSTSPVSKRRVHHSSKRSRSRSKSPPYSRRSRSRSKSPSHNRRTSRRSRSRSNSPSYNRRDFKPGRRDYQQQRYPGNRKGHVGKRFIGKETASYYRVGGSATPIAKAPSGESRADTHKAEIPGNKLSLQSGQSSFITLPTTDYEVLTPEQKLERALQAAQALNPKLSARQLSTGPVLTTTAGLATATAGIPLRNPAVLKKKLIWNKKSSGSKWEGVSFEGEGGDEAQSKFRRLMGMGKKTSSSDASSDTAAVTEGSKMKEKHGKLLDDLQQQYETSRFMTHLARGVGLGYGTSSSFTSGGDDSTT